MSRVLRNAEQLLHIGMLLLLMDAFLPLWREMSGFVVDPVTGDPLKRGILLAGYAVAVSTLVFHPRTTLRIFLRTPVLWLLILWALLSVTWSGAPDVTFRRGVAVVLTTLYGLVLYVRFSFGGFLRLLGVAVVIAVISSLVLALMLPDWGVMGYPHEGAWRGVFVHKNVLGRVAAFSLLVLGALVYQSRTVFARTSWSGAFLMSLVALSGSRSATSLVLAVVTLTGLLFLRLARWLRRAWQVVLLSFFVLMGGLAMFVMQDYETVVQALGRDVTLTGRVPLWKTLIPLAVEHFWLGYGYGGFWLGWDGPSAGVWTTVGWSPSHGHNGYLDLWLDLGAVGLALGLMVLMTPLFRIATSAIRGMFTLESRFVLTLWCYLVAYNFTESTFLQGNSLYWTLLVYAYFLTSELSVRHFNVLPQRDGKSVRAECGTENGEAPKQLVNLA